MKRISGLAITALVLGIISVMLSFVPFLNILLGIAALVFGIIGLNVVKRNGLEGRGMAIAGIVLGAITIFLSIIFIIGIIAYLSTLGL